MYDDKPILLNDYDGNFWCYQDIKSETCHCNIVYHTRTHAHAGQRLQILQIYSSKDTLYFPKITNKR